MYYDYIDMNDFLENLIIYFVADIMIIVNIAISIGIITIALYLVLNLFF